MNLIRFLKYIDEFTAAASYEQLSEFLHEYGRVLPEENRTEFLRQIEIAGKKAKSGGGKQNISAGQDLKTEFKEILAELKQVAIINWDPDEDMGIIESGQASDDNARIQEKYYLDDEDDTDREDDEEYEDDEDEGYEEDDENYEEDDYEDDENDEEDEDYYDYYDLPYIKAEMNEEYDDWYHSDEDEFVYSDPDGILPVIEKACKFVHKCVDTENYVQAYRMSAVLTEMEIRVDGGDYYEESTVSIDELADMNLIWWEHMDFVNDALYAAYFASRPSKRPANIYSLMYFFRQRNITMEKLMQKDSKLPGAEQFLRDWVTYLGTRSSDGFTEKLLKEAIGLADDPAFLLQVARINYREHPGLYEQYIKLCPHGNATDNSEFLTIAQEAMEKIDTNYVVRSRIALLAAEEYQRNGMEQDALRCWMEAFRSDTRLVHYLRLRLESPDYSAIQNTVKQIWDKQDLDKGGYALRKTDENDGEVRKNKISEYTWDMISFFEGNFRCLKENVMNTDKVVGWSSTFMKCGIAAFLMLLLDDNHRPARDSGIRRMCGRVVSVMNFEAVEYQRGLSRKVKTNSVELFLECFAAWKKTVSITEEERAEYLSWIEKLMERRVQGIMDANRRNYYGECAEYIAAIGEVKESLGERNGKKAYLERYRMKYSRRRAFHDELKKFGLT